MVITTNESVLEVDWIERGIGFITTPNGVVRSIGRANRFEILKRIEEDVIL